ncbi:MAG: hypothetical protein WA987_04670 [Cellvibrio sp.]|jgi:hypothetical protein
MKKTLLLISFCYSFFIAFPALACSKPAAKPEIPDAETVVTAQMVKANNEVKAYVKAVEDYIACAKLSRGQEKQELDDLKQFAEDFNVVVRAFKSRSNS